MLSASIEYQRVLASQLASVQQGMADILNKMSALGDEIRLTADRTWIARLHTDLAYIVLSYQSELVRAGNSGWDYTTWASNPLTQAKFVALYLKVDAALAEVESGNRTDEMTSLYLTPALYAAIGVCSVLGESQQSLKGMAQRFLDLFARASDPNVKGSVAFELNRRASALEKSGQSLMAEGFPLSMPQDAATQNMEVGAVRVQHYIAAPKGQKRYCTRSPRSGSEGGGADNCNYMEVTLPPITGEQNYYRFSLPVTPFLVGDSQRAGGAFAIRQFDASSDVSMAGAQASDSYPLHRVDAPSESARRQAALVADAGGRAAQQKASRIRAYVARYNEDAAYCALYAAVLVSLSNARRDTFGFFGVKL